MASRYYPARKFPGVRMRGGTLGAWQPHGVFGTAWTPDYFCWRLSSSKSDSGAVLVSDVRTNQQGDFDLFFSRWSTPPLEAQSISGTIQFCFSVRAVWEDAILPADNSTTVRWKLHVYLADGQTLTLKQTLLDNHVDSVNFPGTSGSVWRSLASAQTLASTSAAAGDVIIVELGFRVVSAPVPGNQYPPSNTTYIPFRATGVNVAHADAVAGDTATTRAGWFEFSGTLTEQAVVSPPANDACVDALVIPPALPYESAEIDTTQSTDTSRCVWWTWTAPSSGKVCFHLFGSNYGSDVAVFTGGCAGLVAVTPAQSFGAFPFLALAAIMFDAVAGTAYWIRVGSTTTGSTAANSGGVCRLSAFYRETTPQIDDLYLPAGPIVQMRDGKIVNLSGLFINDAATGVAIDYTQRTIDDLNGGTHSGKRLLVGLHDFELVELLDLPTLSYGTVGQIEVETIGDPWNVVGDGLHTAQIYVTAAGLLYTGWFGNGYCYVAGEGTLPSILSTVSNDANFAAIKAIDAIKGDIQPGAPFADTLYLAAPEITSPWAIAFDEVNGILYYTSGGLYVPVGGQIIKRYNVNTDTQLTDFATIPLQSGNNPGLKGLQFLPGGGLLVCNSTVVHRLDDAGTLIQTYTPSIPLDSQSLVDVKLTASGEAFWTVDLETSRLFRFDINSGVELETVQLWLHTGTLLQMAIYQPEGAEPPPPVSPPLPAGCPVINLEPRAVTPLHGCPPSTLGV